MDKIFAWVVKLTGWVPYLIGSRPKIYYEDKSVQSRKIRGKAIVMCDHHDVMDYMGVMHLFLGRNLRCLVADVTFDRTKLLSWFLKKLGAIRVRRDDSDFSFIQKATQVLDDNGVVEIYPESRLPKKDEATPLEFKPSVTYIALNSGAPIIPVVTNGKVFKKERFSAMIGKPIFVSEWIDESLSERENIDNITKKLREKIIELKNELNSRTK